MEKIVLVFLTNFKKLGSLFAQASEALLDLFRQHFLTVKAEKVRVFETVLKVSYWENCLKVSKFAKKRWELWSCREDKEVH